MAPVLSTLFLFTAAVAGSNIGTAYEGIVQAAQASLTGKGGRKPMTISASSEIGVTHPAQIAELDIEIRACHTEREEAQKRSDAYLHHLHKEYRGLGCNSTIRFPTSVRDQKDDGWDEDEDDYPFKRHHASKGDDDEEKDKFKDEMKYCGISTLSVTVRDLGLLGNFRGNLSSATAGARLDYIDWKLTDATKALKRTELRRKAMDDMMEVAKDYAAIFGVDEIVPTSLIEQYSYDDVHMLRRRGRSMWSYSRDDVELSVPDVKLWTEFQYSFTV